MTKTYVIGIAGASASGKSTISEKLKDKLSASRVKLIHMDEYYKEEPLRPTIKGIVNGQEYRDDNHPTALDLDLCHRDIEKAVSEHYDVLVVEGIFALWDETIFAQLDLKIFVDCDSDEKLVRRIKRHLSFGQDFDEITERYVQAVKPRQMEFVESTKWKADIILNGFSDTSLGVALIAAWIENGSV